MQDLKITDDVIKKAIKLIYYQFLGVALDENVSWIDRFQTAEGKAPIKTLAHYTMQSKYFINILEKYIFFYTHCYLNQENIARISTNSTKLKRIHYLQKEAISTIFKKYSY